MKVFTVTELTHGPRIGMTASSLVFRSLEDARQSVADDLCLIHQYGLGDGFVLKAGDLIHDDGDGSLRVVGGHNPAMEFDGDEITAWYGPEGEDFDESMPFRRFTITEKTVI